MRLTIARQAVFDAELNTIAYELYFRERLSNVFPANLSDKATAQILESLNLIDDIASVSDHKLCFINFSHNDVLNEFPLMLPAEAAVVEISLATPCSAELVEKVESLKHAGYKISLENLKDINSIKMLVPYADFLKIDGRYLSEHYLVRIDKLENPQCQIVATRVETHAEYERIKALGITYFQGFFFEEPQVMEFHALTLSQMTLSDLLYEASKAEIDLEAIVAVFQRDAALAFKLLRYVQSPVFSWSRQVDSIRQAIIVLGVVELKKFLALLFAAELSEDNPPELVTTSLVRANLCEKLAAETDNLDPSVAFMVGLLSLIDVMVAQPMPDLIKRLPVSDTIKSALTRQNDSPFSSMLNLVDAMEKANWPQVKQLSHQLNISREIMADFYQQSYHWASSQLALVN